ncbi:hypothetical protein [Serinibacter salmoneus]|uniref:Uncharacterized protein n=1 Tax=Serinibacter salmoneus TaxID=556530 RepID=A0A2A9CWQ1_9MICO|nr:hypothetical protein [Serinibacter salmoneus]PFG18833.1 hypothetical protein ATL40_0377 [Serinibacter salmoneus]
MDGVRILRGLAVAAFAVLVALTAHVLAGGSMASPLGVVLPLLLTWVLASALIGPRPRLVPAMLAASAAQGLFHLTFSLGTASPSAAQQTPSGHAAHTAAGIRAALDAAGASHTAHQVESSAPMLLAHVAAACITAAALHHGEVLLRTAARLTRPFAVLRLLRAWRPVTPDAGATIPTAPPVMLTGALLVRTRPGRGPPAVLLTA